jgi:hypothetical protein
MHNSSVGAPRWGKGRAKDEGKLMRRNNVYAVLMC